MKKELLSFSTITVFACALTFAGCKKKEEAPPPPPPASAPAPEPTPTPPPASDVNQIHQLLARRLVQKEEQPKANTFQFSTGFRLVSARAFARYGDEYL